MAHPPQGQSDSGERKGDFGPLLGGAQKAKRNGDRGHFWEAAKESDIMPYVLEGKVMFEPFRGFLERCSQQGDCFKLCVDHVNYVKQIFQAERSR